MTVHATPPIRIGPTGLIRDAGLSAQLLCQLDETFSVPSMTALLGEDAAGLAAHHWEKALLGPLRDFLSRPGKSFRKRLTELSFRAAGGSGPCPPLLAQVVEILHAGSLVVDDIEDEAVERRGAPALHRVYGMDCALNAGNWLYFWPSVLVSECGLPPERELDIHRRISRTLHRCHFGQALDLSLDISELAQTEVLGAVASTTRLKTASLLSFAAELGAIAADAQPPMVERLGDFGTELGVALQMLDDLSGVAGANRREKAREDIMHGRPTWVWAWLSTSLSPTEFAALQSDVKRVEDGRETYEDLRQRLAASVRSQGIEAVHAVLTGALASVTECIEDNETIDAIREEVARLEKMYG